MKKPIITISLGALSMLSFGQDKLSTSTGHSKFFSHTVAEDIEAHNYKVISNLTPSTGVIVFSIAMQSFEFEKALMQKHFNLPKFLDTKQFPKAKFKGKINDLSEVDFSKDGNYEVEVSGDLTIHGVTKAITEKGNIKIKNGKINVTSTFKIVLADYNIAFEKGKPSTNIAREIEVSVELNYNKS